MVNLSTSGGLSGLPGCLTGAQCPFLRGVPYPTYAGSVDTKFTVGGYGNKLGPGTAHAGPLTNRQVALS